MMFKDQVGVLFPSAKHAKVRYSNQRYLPNIIRILHDTFFESYIHGATSNGVFPNTSNR